MNFEFTTISVPEPSFKSFGKSATNFNCQKFWQAVSNKKAKIKPVFFSILKAL
jgi:hypothetical protein